MILEVSTGLAPAEDPYTSGVRARRESREEFWKGVIREEAELAIRGLMPIDPETLNAGTLVDDERQIDDLLFRQDIIEIDKEADGWVASCVAENIANGYMEPPHYIRDIWRRGFLIDLVELKQAEMSSYE